MYFHIIASGSKGNATLVVSNKTVLLIDMGITLKVLKETLEKAVCLSPMYLIKR